MCRRHQISCHSQGSQHRSLIFRCQGFWAAWRLRWRADEGAVGRNLQAALRLRRGIRQADESNSLRDHEDDDECELCATPASLRDQRPFYTSALSMEDSRVRVNVLVVQDENALMPMGDQARVRFCERVPDDRCAKQAKLFAVSFLNNCLTPASLFFFCCEHVANLQLAMAMRLRASSVERSNVQDIMLYSKRGAHSACECRDFVASHDSCGRLAAGHGGEDEIFDATADLPSQRLRDPAPTTPVNRRFFVTRGELKRHIAYPGLSDWLDQNSVCSLPHEPWTSPCVVVQCKTHLSTAASSNARTINNRYGNHPTKSVARPPRRRINWTQKYSRTQCNTTAQSVKTRAKWFVTGCCEPIRK